MRTLVDWPFWRALISIGISLLLWAHVVWHQPFFRLLGNFYFCYTFYRNEENPDFMRRFSMRACAWRVARVFRAARIFAFDRRR
jgi:hypothetical protein